MYIILNIVMVILMAFIIILKSDQKHYFQPDK